jgi:hypothetical protein
MRKAHTANMIFDTPTVIGPARNSAVNLIGFWLIAITTACRYFQLLI